MRVPNIDNYYQVKRNRFFVDVFNSRAIAQQAEMEFDRESAKLAEARKILSSALKNSCLLFNWYR